jgi:hypothetical protein
MLSCMQSTSVRIDTATHEELKRLAASLGTTVGGTVALAVRRLRQERIGEELTGALSSSEAEWLDAELG